MPKNPLIFPMIARSTLTVQKLIHLLSRLPRRPPAGDSGVYGSWFMVYGLLLSQQA